MSEYYYVFEDDNHQLYYFCSSTNSTTYEKPADGIFLDPNTNEEYNFGTQEQVAPEPAQPQEVEPDAPHEETPPAQEEPVEQPHHSNEEKRHHKSSKNSSETRKSKPTVQIQEPIKESQPKAQEETSDNDADDPASKIKYYVYKDSKSQKLYYYNTKTGESTYNKPEKGKFFDPDTKKRFVFEDSIVARPRSNTTIPKHEEHKKSKRHSQISDSSTILSNATVKATKSSGELERRNTIQPRMSFYPDPKNLSLPENLKSEIHQFQAEDFAKRFFKEKRATKRFSRKKFTFESLAEFQNSPLSTPLSLTMPKNLAKDAINLFNHILNYTCANKDKPKPTSLQNIITIARKSPPLVDELYFQLIKQTNKNPNEECLIKTYELFVIAASIFPSSRDSESWIKSHLDNAAKTETNKTVADYAQFSSIRFSTRCSLGKQLDNIPKPSAFINDVYSSKVRFGSSIYEQLWIQRETHKLPFPIIIKQMADLLLSKGAESYEGIFRLPGSKRVIDDTQEKINQGKELDPNMAMNDLASLFKSWFAMLPEKVIPEESTSDLQSAFDTKDYIGFVDKLPKAHAFTLKYLIGFLQQMARSSNVTKMTASNLSICFGPNLVYEGDVHDMAGFEKYKNNVNEMLTFLIQELDTTEIYPCLL